MTRRIVFIRAIQAIRLHEGQLPIGLPALETGPDRRSVDALMGITIRMYETRRPKTDTTDKTELFNFDMSRSNQIHVIAEEQPLAEDEETDDDSRDCMSGAMEDGSVFLMKPK